MMALAVVVRTTPRCVMTINKSDQPALNKRASQHQRSGESSTATHGNERSGNDHLMEMVVERSNVEKALSG